MKDESKGPAIVAKRAPDAPVETREITDLAEAAGYDVRDALTQVRTEDPGTNLGAGKVEELAARVAETGSRTVAVDNELTPSQHLAIAEATPDGTTVRDRYRVILEIFGEQASTKRATLQVELAQLRYDLPRIEERSDVAPMNRYTEKGSPIYDIRDRIDTLQRTLDEQPDPAEGFRERRREQGFDLVTIAGYTNAGKSTLLHRLADDLDLDDREPAHPDEDPIAAVEDRLFKTLETTTRRATLDGRGALLTDTVGFVSDLPHWLVRSFSETLSEAGAADAVVLVADASDPVEELNEKLRLSLSVLDEQDVDRGDVVTALNKVDLLDEGTVERRLATAREVAPDVVPVSVLHGRNLDALAARVLDCLPTAHEVVELPNCDAAMSAVSWAYDHLVVEDVDYGAPIRVTVSGRPDVIERFRAKAAAA